MLETNFFSTYFLPGTLAVIMFGMGMSLTTADFRNIFLYPKAVITGLLSQMIVLPAIAIALAYMSGLPAEMQVGIVLIAACPGGAASNLLSYLLKGNVALSVSMTSINSLLTIFSIPFIVNIGLKLFSGTSRAIEMPVFDTIIQILIITVIPVVLGILARRYAPGFAQRTHGPLKVAMPAMLAVAIMAAIFLEKKAGVPISLSEYLAVLPWAFGLNIISMAFGWGIAWLLGLGRPNQVTIGLEVGLQNSGLAIAVATSAFLLDDPRLAVPAATYALFSFFTAVAFGLISNRKEVRLADLFRSSKAK